MTPGTQRPHTFTDEELSRMRQEVLAWLEQERRGQNSRSVKPSTTTPRRRTAAEKSTPAKPTPPAAATSSNTVRKPRRKPASARRLFRFNPIAAAVMVSAAVLAILFPLIGIYVLGQDAAYFRPLSRWLPLPAAYLDGPPIMVREYLGSAAALGGHFRRRSPWLSMRQIHQYVFARLVEQRALELVAKQHAIQLPPSAVDRQLSGLIAEVGSRQQFVETLGKEFPGWGVSEFATYLLQPYLLRQMLHHRLSSEPASWANAEQTAWRVRAQLNAGQLSFDQAARRYSRDAAAALGGDLGYVTLGNLAPEVAAVVSTLPRGQISEPIRSPAGYHLVLVRESLGPTENTLAIHYRVQQILISTAPDMRTLLHQASQALNVRRLVAWPMP